MTDPNPVVDKYVAEYNDLRAQLQALCTAPTRDKAAINAVMVRLDEVHAEFKAHYGHDERPGLDDHQRY